MSTENRNLNRIVVVNWLDSCIRSEQSPLTDLPELAKISTVGFVLSDNAQRIVLTQDLFDDDQRRSTIAIPQSTILSRRELSYAD